MPAATMGWVVPGILGAAGLGQANSAQRRQDEAMNSAQALQAQGVAINNQVTQEKLDSMRRLREYVSGHDYDADTTTAIRRANDVAGEQLQRGLRKYDSDWQGSGGAPGQSSEYYVRKAGMTRGVMDPLRELAAQRSLMKHSQKMADEMAIQGIPTGQLADGYFKGSQLAGSLGGGGGDFSGGIRALMQMINNIPGINKGNARANQTGGGGGGGSDTSSDTGNNTRWWS